MNTRKIGSLQHPLVKHLVKLREKRHYREEQKSAFVLGRRMVQTIAPHTQLNRVVTLNEQTEFSAEEQLIVTPEILKKISGTPSPEPIAAEVALPKNQKISGKLLLALDKISDPGNLGTLIRTAYAFGADGVFLTEGSADPFNDKALRAAKGATFLIAIQQGSLVELLELSKKIPTFIADLDGKQLTKPQTPALLILGNESHGPSSELASIGERITIPMRKEIDSLNVAIAGSILLHQLRSL
ncbi:MAG: RNA methyltransferase [Candidatus Algichlamydia australiensis]|nr:RNA methyltransferase [Chlamydiales bacterium]